MRYCLIIILTLSIVVPVYSDTSVTDLPEVVVHTRDREVLHLLGYMRETSTLTTYDDTVMLFREKMVDFMIPSYKVKNFKGWLSPRILASRSYYHFTSSAGLDSVSDRYRQHFSWSDWVRLHDNIPVPEGLREEITASDSVAGKSSPAQIWDRYDTDMSITIDVLADSINAPWVPDLTNYIYGHSGNVEFNKFKITLDYKGIDNTLLLIDNLAEMKVDIDTSGRARNMFRVFNTNTPYFVTTHANLYVIDREYVPVKVARKIEKSSDAFANLDIYSPPEAGERGVAIETLMARVEAVDHTNRRLTMSVDDKVGGIKIGESKYNHGFLGLLYKHLGIRL